MNAVRRSLLQLDGPDDHDMLRRAMRHRDKHCPEGAQRPWLYAGTAAPYVHAVTGAGAQDYRVEFYALQGTPMRGFIVYYPGIGEATRYNAIGKRLRTYWRGHYQGYAQ